MNSVSLFNPDRLLARIRGLGAAVQRAHRIRTFVLIVVILVAVTPEADADRRGRGLFNRGGGRSNNSQLTQYGVPPSMREGDEVWFINTRGMRRRATHPDAFQVSCFKGGVESDATIEDLIVDVSQEDDLNNVFFVHGNRTNYYWAVQRGWLVYDRVVSNCPDHQSVRLVVWAWPSEQEYGPIRDFRDKAALADFEGRHFGWVLSRINPNRPLGLIGYSFGSRVIMNGLNQVARFGYQNDDRVAEHALRLRLFSQLDEVKRQALETPEAVQQLAQRGLTTIEEQSNQWLGSIRTASLVSKQNATQPVADFENDSTAFDLEWDAVQEPVDELTVDETDPDLYPRYNVALVAAAFDREWILPGNCFGDAYDLTDRMLLVNNCSDKALKYFGFIKRGSFPTALGKVGPGCWQRLSDLGAKIKQIDVSREVGTEHKIDLYFSSPSVISRLHEEILHVE